MSRFLVIACCSLLTVGVSDTRAQIGSLPLSTFGYFQTSFQYRGGNVQQYLNKAVVDTTVRMKTFSLQQLNLFFQSDVASRWRAFVDFQLLNNYSSSLRWGSFNLEEAWLRFRPSEYMSAKVGIQIPIFNHLNEIKNRTPLLPYVVRPLVYESSFAEVLDLEAYLPERAFVQVYGYLPLNRAVKLDYAAYVGNSPNIANQRDNERSGGSIQTGVDSTTTFLVGGRVGLRYRDMKVGVSATRDETEEFQRDAVYFDLPADRLSGVARTRMGVDIELHPGRFSLEAEGIKVLYDTDPADLSLDRYFYYATLGYYVTDRLFVFAGFWRTVEQRIDIHPGQPGAYLNLEQTIDVPNVGVAFTILDRITLKAHYAPVDIEVTCSAPAGTLPCPVRVVDDELIHYFTSAVSVLF